MENNVEVKKITCSACGEELAEGFAFCPKCGNKIGEDGNKEAVQVPVVQPEAPKSKLKNTKTIIKIER